MSHLKGKPPIFLIFKSSKWRPLNKIKTLLVSAIIAKSWHWARDCYKFKYIRHLQPSIWTCQRPPNPQRCGSAKPQGLFPILPLNWFGEKFLQIGDESLPVLIDTRVTLWVLNPTTIKQFLPQNTKRVQIVGSLMNLKRFLSLNLFHLFRPSERYTLFSPEFLHPYPFIRPGLLRIVSCWVCFSWKWEIILEFDSGHQSNQQGELNAPLTSFTCSVSEGTRTDCGNTDHLPFESATTLLKGKISN